VSDPRFYVTTAHYTVPVYFVESKDDDWNPPGDEEMQGNTSAYLDNEALVIYVRLTGTSPQRQANSVLHEVLHLCMDVGGVGEGKMSEEDAVSNMTAGLKQLLVADNDALFDYLGVNL
jgi:hypothetical protein